MSEIVLASQYSPIDLLNLYTGNNRSLMEFDSRVADLATAVAKRYLSNPGLPEKIRNNEQDLVLIAIKAFSLGVSASSAFEKCYVVNGKVAYETDFIRQLVERSERWYGFEYDIDIDPDQPEVETFKSNKELDKIVKNKRCRAYAYDKHQKDHEGNPLRVNGPWVSVAMAVGEKWWSKEGSKWPTMTEYMLRKRAYAYWAKEHAQTALNGLVSVDVFDDQEVQVIPQNPVDAAAQLKSKGVKMGQATRPVAKPEPAKTTTVDAEEAQVVDTETGEVTEASASEAETPEKQYVFPEPAEGTTWEDYSYAELLGIHQMMRECPLFTDTQRNNMVDHINKVQNAGHDEATAKAEVLKAVNRIAKMYVQLQTV